ncbi:hypothetical protein BP5796_08964 [Coleophoma crateriformis]|uniref:Xylanolytic transcriptional activator regulatory domain-containing protein n=1 Tax=Coleophoma crateriformis TaxID=565419 RepID=A0A3D8R2Q8_9HELO|nr:hypothetical protein BP5796_08964 [Coleophoma crateriformis]
MSEMHPAGHLVYFPLARWCSWSTEEVDSSKSVMRLSFSSATNSFTKEPNLKAGPLGSPEMNRSRDHDIVMHDDDASLAPPGSQSHQMSASTQSVVAGLSPVAMMDRQFPTDVLCSRPMLVCMLNDYLDLIYPLIPVVHRPSFRRDLAKPRDLEDPDFLGLIVAMCAAINAIMPRKFREYRSAISPLKYQTRTEMINHCCDIYLGLRSPEYFDEINHQKWAASYLLSIAFFQIGQHNRARMIEVEAMQLARLLEIHQISSYDGLNCIETQLRKKAFWLMFYGYVHSQLQNLRKERLTFLDAPILNNIKLEELMPLEVDDELIHEDVVLPQPASELSLTTGFNIHSRIFWAALTNIPAQDSPVLAEPCDCQRSRNPVLQYEHLEGRVQQLKYMLDDGLPMQLRQWSTGNIEDPTESPGSEHRRVVRSQFEAMRANIHVTHLWLQSIISDQIDTIRPSAGDLQATGDQRLLWGAREDLCRQLLHVLHSIEGVHLEPNGHHLTETHDMQSPGGGERSTSAAFLLCKRHLDIIRRVIVEAETAPDASVTPRIRCRYKVGRQIMFSPMMY